MTPALAYFCTQTNLVPFFVVPAARLPCFCTGYVPPLGNPERWMYADEPPS